jgi:hypothetical protein
MANEGSQVLVKFVTKLPAELTVPETQVVGVWSGTGPRQTKP